eukprot:scaffold6521_cov83-Phaeocystis_antarctica.AAC.3
MVRVNAGLTARRPKSPWTWLCECPTNGTSICVKWNCCDRGSVVITRMRSHSCLLCAGAEPSCTPLHAFAASSYSLKSPQSTALSGTPSLPPRFTIAFRVTSTWMSAWRTFTREYRMSTCGATTVDGSRLDAIHSHVMRLRLQMYRSSISLTPDAAICFSMDSEAWAAGIG